MPVYFVQAGEGGPIKIGRAVNPAARIAILQTGHHERLRVLRTINGGAHAETWLHRRFAGRRLRGKWFRFDSEMLVVEPPDVPYRPHDPGLLFSYLDQLEQAAQKAEVDLADACRQAGVAATTLQRWRNGDMTPRKATAEDVLARIHEMAAERPPTQAETEAA